jgi:cell division protein ZapA
MDSSIDKSSDSVRVIIYGEEYSIKGDADKEKTKQIAEYVNLKILEVQTSIASRDKFKIAILSAVNIAAELLGYKEKCEKYLNKCEELNKKVQTISDKIDKNIE